MAIADAHLHVASEPDADGRPVVDAPMAITLMDGPFIIDGNHSDGWAVHHRWRAR